MTDKGHPRAILELALDLATMHARIAGGVTADDVVETLVEQLAAAVVGIALERGTPIDTARAQIVATLEEAIGSMAADVEADDEHLTPADAGADTHEIPPG